MGSVPTTQMIRCPSALPASPPPPRLVGSVLSVRSPNWPALSIPPQGYLCSWSRTHCSYTPLLLWRICNFINHPLPLDPLPCPTTLLPLPPALALSLKQPLPIRLPTPPWLSQTLLRKYLPSTADTTEASKIGDTKMEQEAPPPLPDVGAVTQPASETPPDTGGASLDAGGSPDKLPRSRRTAYLGSSGASSSSSSKMATPHPGRSRREG